MEKIRQGAWLKETGVCLLLLLILLIGGCGGSGGDDSAGFSQADLQGTWTGYITDQDMQTPNLTVVISGTNWTCSGDGCWFHLENGQVTINSETGGVEVAGVTTEGDYLVLRGQMNASKNQINWNTIIYENGQTHPLAGEIHKVG